MYTRLLVRTAAALIAATAALAAPLAVGQAYPSKDIRFICTFPAGSGADVLVRYFAEDVQKISGRTVIVENKSGAAGLIGTEYVAHARPDGYTVLVHAGSAIANVPALYKKPPIDVSKSFEVVGTINRQPFMIAVDAKSPYKTLAQLTEAMKKKGEKATYGTSATTGTVMGEIYKARTGIKAVEVQYKTGSDSLNDQLSGRLDYTSLDPVYAIAQQNEGRLRLLGVSTGERLQANPSIPTMKEQGVDMDVTGWWAAFVPVGTPAPAKAKLYEWFHASIVKPQTKAFLNKFGGDPLIETPEQAQARLIRDIAAWKEYAKIARLVPQ